MKTANILHMGRIPLTVFHDPTTGHVTVTCRSCGAKASMISKPGTQGKFEMLHEADCTAV